MLSENRWLNSFEPGVNMDIWLTKTINALFAPSNAGIYVLWKYSNLWQFWQRCRHLSPLVSVETHKQWCPDRMKSSKQGPLNLVGWELLIHNWITRNLFSYCSIENQNYRVPVMFQKFHPGLILKFVSHKKKTAVDGFFKPLFSGTKNENPPIRLDEKFNAILVFKSIKPEVIYYCKPDPLTLGSWELLTPN